MVLPHTQIDSTHHPRFKAWQTNAGRGGATRHYSFTFQSVTNAEDVIKNGKRWRLFVGWGLEFGVWGVGGVGVSVGWTRHEGRGCFGSVH